MLLLTRKPGEAVIIGDFIRISIRSINDNKVKLAIEAPNAVPVHREEIHTRIKKEKKKQQSKKNNND